MLIKQTTLAYLAGMIDGDGYISITKSTHKGKLYFGAQIGIAGTRREPHDLASSIWGGKVYKYIPKNLLHRPQYQWSRVGRVAADAIEAVYPYLLIKKEHAALALELFEHVQFSKEEDSFPWLLPDYDPGIDMDLMRNDMIELNQSRNRVGKKAAGRLLDNREWNEFPKV